MALKAALFSCIDTKEGVKPRKKVQLAFIFQVVMDFFITKLLKGCKKNHICSLNTVFLPIIFSTLICIPKFANLINFDIFKPWINAEGQYFFYFHHLVNSFHVFLSLKNPWDRNTIMWESFINLALLNK